MSREGNPPSDWNDSQELARLSPECHETVTIGELVPATGDKPRDTKNLSPVFQPPSEAEGEFELQAVDP
ncbi:MAG: hypothetical protein AMXMBFR74_21120 [Parvibaculum sp.]